MDELIAFLRDRYADIERIALDVPDGWRVPWAVAHHYVRTREAYHDLGEDLSARHRAVANLSLTVGNYECEQAVGKHIARHDPARVLADVAAKRAILDLHYIIERKVNWTDAEGDERQDHQPVCVICVEKYSTVNVPADLGPCETVRLLALPFADHPGYQESWKP
jgi:hypothetical protein